MFVVQKSLLKLISALVWHIGGVILLLKTRRLMLEAASLNAPTSWFWITAIIGLSVGFIKSYFLLIKTCKKNLARIDQLTEPKLWQFFRPGFFLALALMIATGSTLSRMADGNAAFLLVVAAIDIGMSSALLSSSYVFWQQFFLRVRLGLNPQTTR